MLAVGLIMPHALFGTICISETEESIRYIDVEIVRLLRVVDPGGVDPNPLCKKKPVANPSVKKIGPRLDPTFENNLDPEVK